jgi:ABC-type nitrate/sulfonate/bicarbonate transport system substrate-binding protein
MNMCVEPRSCAVGTALRRALGGIAAWARAFAHPTIAAAAAACMSAQAPAHAQGSSEDITMAVPNITFNLTATFIADDLGLWGKHGLRFKMIQVTGVGAANAVIAGSADFSQGGGSTLTRAAARGQRLLAIASTADRNIVAITLRKELAPGFDPKAPLAQRAQVLRGRTIAVGAIQANPHAYLRVIAARGGIDPESIRVTAMEGNGHAGRVPDQGDRRHVVEPALPAQAGARRRLDRDRERARR